MKNNLSKGLSLGIISNILFVIIGYIIHYYLGNTMSASQYGTMGTIITILDFEYLFLNNGTRQSLSNTLAMQKFNTIDIIKKATILQVIVIIIMFSINYGGATFFASVLNDDGLIKYLKLVAFIIPINGFFVLTLGINEGVHRFSESAITGIVYCLAKLSVIPLVEFVFNDAMEGTIFGFLIGLFAALGFGVISIVKHKEVLNSKIDDRMSFRVFAKSTFGFSVFFIIVSVILSVDTLVVKSIILQPEMTGYYTGAVNFSKVSYYLLTAFFTISLPVVTKCYEDDEIQKLNSIMKKIITIILIFIFPITLIISSTSKVLLVSFYNIDFKTSSVALTILAFSHFIIGITVLLNMIIAGANKKKFSTILALSIFVVDLVLAIFLTKQIGINGTAIASIISSLIAVGFSINYIIKLFNQIIVKEHIKIIALGLLYWFLLLIASKYLIITNLLYLLIIYALLYFVWLIIMMLFKVLNINEIKEYLETFTK